MTSFERIDSYRGAAVGGAGGGHDRRMFWHLGLGYGHITQHLCNTHLFLLLLVRSSTCPTVGLRVEFPSKSVFE